MSQNLDIELKPVIPKEYPNIYLKIYKRLFLLQLLKNLAQMNIFHLKTIYYPHLLTKNAVSFHIIYNNQCAGGVVLMIDKNTHYNSLDLFSYHQNIMETAWVLQHGKPLRKISRYNHMENNYAIF